MATTVSGLSCAEDVTAVLGTDVPFTLFGVVTPQLDRQVVRLFSIDEVLAPIPPTPLDAILVSTSQSDGHQRLWRDSIIAETDGMFAHVFTSSFSAVYGETYSLTATRDDGAQTTVSVTVPDFSNLVVPPVTERPPAVLDALVTGTPPNLIRVEVAYHYKFRSLSGTERDSTRISYDGIGSQQPAGFRIPIQVERDAGLIRALLKDRLGFDVELRVVLIRVTMIVANKEWSPPGGVFDPEILVEPGTMSNVRNGFGFVGAGYRLAKSWAPTDTVLTKR